MRRAHVLVALSNAAEAGPAAQTGKVFEYLIARRPILMLAPASPARELVEEARAGVVADPTDDRAIEDALESIVRIATNGQFEGATNVFLRRYDRRVQAERWSALLIDVIRASDQERRPSSPQALGLP
jgi:glycosyltransferase involved in cell wall biosynthesis